jgi:hypothetical protein
VRFGPLLALIGLIGLLNIGFSPGNEEEDQKYNAIIDPGAKHIHDQEARKAQLFCQKWETAISLEPDHKAKLEALVASAVDQAVAQWRAQARTIVPGLMSNGFLANQIAAFEESLVCQSFDQQPILKNGLAKIFSNAELEKLKSVSNESIAERVRIMGLVFVSIMDEKVGLTSAQRLQLKPLSERLVKDDQVLCPTLLCDNNTANSTPNSAIRFTATYVYDLAKKATDDELKPILDSAQIVRWRANPPDRENRNRSAEPDFPPAPEMDTPAEHVEEVISKKLYNEQVAERKTTENNYSLKEEKIIRILSPAPDVAEKLRFAILSLVEKHMCRFNSSSESQLRNQLNEVTPENIDDQIQTAYFRTQFLTAANDPTGRELETLVKSIFSKDQVQALQKESDDRHLFISHTLRDLISDDFSRRFSLDDHQREKIASLIEKVMQDYEEDIPTSYFTVASSVSWVTNPSLEFLPLIGVSEADLKAVLSDEQLKVWEESQERFNTLNYWPQLEQFHQIRLRQEQQGNGQPRLKI